MPNKLQLKWLDLITILMGVFLFILMIIIFIFTGSIGSAFTKSDPVLESSRTSSIGQPVYLKIPKIGVHAPIEYVGLTAKGAMDAPVSPDNVGWYYMGSRPGDIGNAVIDGHSGWKDGISAVFDSLYTLEKNDRIYTEDEQGNVNTFIVREIRIYNPEADTSSVFESVDGKAHLNLITCTGDWDEIGKSHKQRLVVFADKEQ